MSWSRSSFLDSYTSTGCAYHGSADNLYFPLSFLSQLDIDTMADYEQALLLQSLLPVHT